MKYPENFRVMGVFAEAGVFMVPGPCCRDLKVIASSGLGWDHVSVSLPNRCPNWPEMCHIKELFWDAEEAVMQLHPPKSQWINNHAYCLHLWRPQQQEIPLPQGELVGLKGVEPEQMKELLKLRAAIGDCE